MNRFLIPIFLFTYAFSSAQNASISGTISFEDNGTPVAYAYIFIKSINKQTFTNTEGAFELENIPYGTYELEVTSMEIVSKTIKITHNATTQDLKLAVQPLQDIQLNEVSVTGKSKKNRIESQGFAVNVIKTKEAGFRNLQTNDLLSRTVGIRIRQNGGLGSEVNYNINGLSGNSIRVFIDGIPIATYGSSFDLNSIPPSMIDRIEVYKGVVPGHLSDDSLGGAINVVLNKSAKNTFNISASYGSFNTVQTNFNGLYRLEDSGFTIKASGFLNYSDNNYEVWGPNVYNIAPNGRQEEVRAKRFNDAFRSLGGVVQAGFTDVKWADNFFIGFTRSDAYKEIQHGTFMTVPYKGRFTESDASLINLTYDKKDLFTEGLDLNIHGIYGERNRSINDTVKYNYNWYGERSLDLNGQPILRPQGAQQGAATLATITREIASLRAGLSYEINDTHKILLNHLLYSIDREDDDAIRSVLERQFFGTRDLMKNVTSLTYEFNAFDNRLKTSLFGKNYQQHLERMNPTVVTIDGVPTRVEQVVDRTITKQGYGIAASYQAAPKVTLLASSEKAVRLPTENELFGDAGDNIIENPNLKPETSTNFNVGFKVGTLNSKKHDVAFAANGFYRNITDRIGTQVQTSLNSNVQVLPYENQGDVTSLGLDVELNYTYDTNLNIGLNVSKFDLTYKNAFNERKVPNEPTFTINGSVRYNFQDVFQENSRLSAFYNVLFVDTFNYLLEPYGNNAGTDYFDVPQQFIHDLGLSYTFPKRNFVVSFDAKNIFDKRAFDNFAVQKPGRAFYIKLNYTINNL